MSTSLKYNTNSGMEYTRQTSPIVHGNFPVHESRRDLAVSKLNRFLSVLLGMSVFVSLTGYSCVTAKEVKLSKMHKETMALNYENIELQNKVDYMKSYYNVDKQISSQNLLAKASEVLEVKAINPSVKVDLDNSDFNLHTVLGY